MAFSTLCCRCLLQPCACWLAASRPRKTHPDPATLTTTTHLGLTPAYLAGPWCFTHVQFPNERSDENIQYRFNPDGTFATQNAPGSKLQPGFSYSYKPDGRLNSPHG